MTEVSKAFKPNKKDTATAAAGGAVLGATAGLPRVERAVQGAQKKMAGRKVDAAKRAFEQHSPTMGATGRRAPSSPEAKAAFKLKRRQLAGELSAARGKYNRIGRPHLAGNAKATWAGIALGAPMVVRGVRNQFSKSADYKRHDADAGLVGAALGAGGYQEASYALKPMDRKAERKIADNPTLKARQQAHQAKFARPKNAKAGDASWRPYFRNYPKDLPGGKLKRTLAITHTGRSGGALTVTAAAAGAAGAAELSRRHRVQKNTEIFKRADWMNITEHQRRARDSRRTKQKAGTTAILAGGATNAVGLAGGYRQAGPVARSVKSNAKYAYHVAKYPGATRNSKASLIGVAGKNVKTAAKLRPLGAATVAGGAITAGAIGVSAGARLNEKRHDTAIARQRKARVSKADEMSKRFVRKTSIAAVGAAGTAAASAHTLLEYERKKVKKDFSPKQKKVAGGALTALGAGIGYKGAKQIDGGLKTLSAAKRFAGAPTKMAPGGNMRAANILHSSGQNRLRGGMRVFGTGMGVGLAGGQVARNGRKQQTKGLAR